MLTLLLQVVVVLVVVGLILWALAQLPIDPAIAKIIRVFIIVIVCIFLIVMLCRLIGVPVG
jgi:hypothetical protein